MQSIAFFNNKGGVGKTTLLCNVAAYLSTEKDKKILIVDADPQCNATQLLLDEAEVYELYDSAKSFTIHSVVHPSWIRTAMTAELVAKGKLRDTVTPAEVVADRICDQVFSGFGA